MKADRKQQILEALARELESNPGDRITTAKLARALDVSEAALYRHFPSKAKMFEALIDFAETSVFGLITRILEDETQCDARCFQIGAVVLKFAERNPGITRILVGDILLGEHERLRRRIAQFYQRIETQFSQILREGLAPSTSQKKRAEVGAIANLMTATLSGKLAQFVRSEYSVSPSEYWDTQGRLLVQAAFIESE